MAELNRFESIAERRMREAAEQGEFDDLAGQGQPIQGLAQPYDPAWWAKRFIAREQLADLERARLAEIDRQLVLVWPLRSVTEVRNRIGELNTQLAARDAPLFDADEIVTMWRRFGIYRRT